MNIAATLTLQSVPFAGIVIAGSRHKDPFIIGYLSCVGLILTLAALFGDDLVDAASLVTIVDCLASN